MSKITKTFTIEEDVWKKYDIISKENSINKSLQLENFMKTVIKKYEKYDIDGKS